MNLSANLIHQNDKLRDIQKHYFSKWSLVVTAPDWVTLDDSQSSLFKAVTDRFGDKQLYVNSHINELISLEIPSRESAKCLKSIVEWCHHILELLNW